MDYQKKILVNRIIQLGWELKCTEHPESFHYWWIYELLTFKKNNKHVYISFIIDPQTTKSKSNVYEVGLTFKDPESRFDAINYGSLFLKNNWEDRIDEFLYNLY